MPGEGGFIVKAWPPTWLLPSDMGLASDMGPSDMDNVMGLSDRDVSDMGPSDMAAPRRNSPLARTIHLRKGVTALLVPLPPKKKIR